LRRHLAAPFMLIGSVLASSAAAQAAPEGGNEGLSVKPLLTARLRYETVDQDAPLDDAEALTLRLRFGAEASLAGLSILAEAESTRAFEDDYNDTLPGNGIEPFPVVADPENIEINRAQVSWMKDGS